MDTRIVRQIALILVLSAPVYAHPFRQYRVAVPGNIDDIAVTDLNGDAYADIVVIDTASKKLRVLLGDSHHAYSSQYTKGYSKMGNLIAGVGDFTGDGKTDIAVDSVLAAVYFAIFPGKGNGDFLAAKPVNAAGYEAELNSATAIDLDHDGRLDIVGLSKYASTTTYLAAFSNLGGGKFSVSKLKEGVDYDSLAVADFDGDGFTDVLVGELLDTDSLYFFKSKGDGAFTGPRVTRVGNIGVQLAAGDLNGDRKMDVVGDGNYWGEGWSMLGKGTGQFTKRKLLNGVAGMSCLLLADITGDKKVDLVEAGTDGILLHTGKGDGSFTYLTTLGENLRFDRHRSVDGNRTLGMGDVNGDKKMDIVAAQWEMSDSAFDKFDKMSNLLLYIDGESPSTLAISNLQTTKLSYSPGFVTVQGSVSFQDSTGDLRYVGAREVSDNAHLAFRVELDFPYPFDDYLIDYMVTGAFLNLPGNTTGSIGLNLALPAGVISTVTPAVSLSDFYLWNYSLVGSNGLALAEPLAESGYAAEPPQPAHTWADCGNAQAEIVRVLRRPSM